MQNRAHYIILASDRGAVLRACMSAGNSNWSSPMFTRRAITRKLCGSCCLLMMILARSGDTAPSTLDANIFDVSVFVSRGSRIIGARIESARADGSGCVCVLEFRGFF